MALANIVVQFPQVPMLPQDASGADKVIWDYLNRLQNQRFEVPDPVIVIPEPPASGGAVGKAERFFVGLSLNATAQTLATMTVDFTGYTGFEVLLSTAIYCTIPDWVTTPPYLEFILRRGTSAGTAIGDATYQPARSSVSPLDEHLMVALHTVDAAPTEDAPQVYTLTARNAGNITPVCVAQSLTLSALLYTPLP